jgi:hypothetical protein
MMTKQSLPLTEVVTKTKEASGMTMTITADATTMTTITADATTTTTITTDTMTTMTVLHNTLMRMINPPGCSTSNQHQDRTKKRQHSPSCRSILEEIEILFFLIFIIDNEFFILPQICFCFKFNN